MTKAVIIPARYSSVRFPGKPLARLGQKTVIQHVYERSLSAGSIDEVIVATDHEEIFREVLGFGGKAVMTRPDHPSGTDRIAEVAKERDYDIIVNVQGDEPLITGEMIEQVVGLLDEGEADIATLARASSEPSEYLDPNIVKVVLDRRGYALYFSRAKIPFFRDLLLDGGTGEISFYTHIGIYGYRRGVLLALTGLDPAPLERAERLEQLRALFNGYRIRVGITENKTFGIDTPEDLERVERWLNSSL